MRENKYLLVAPSATGAGQIKDAVQDSSKWRHCQHHDEYAGQVSLTGPATPATSPIGKGHRDAERRQPDQVVVGRNGNDDADEKRTLHSSRRAITVEDFSDLTKKAEGVVGASQSGGRKQHRTGDAGFAAVTMLDVLRGGISSATIPACRPKVAAIEYDLFARAGLAAHKDGALHFASRGLSLAIIGHVGLTVETRSGNVPPCQYPLSGPGPRVELIRQRRGRWLARGRVRSKSCNCENWLRHGRCSREIRCLTPASPVAETGNTEHEFHDRECWP